jgi:hypothetical protein
MIAVVFLAGSLAVLVASGAEMATGVTAIETQETGVLTMCQNWFGYHNCKSYSHVVVPKRVVLHDTLELRFGSSNKQYNFPVERIIKNGSGCTVLDAADGDSERTSRIRIASCRDMTGSR